MPPDLGLRQARSEKLQEEIKILIDWLDKRLHPGHDELTTLTMLQRKVERIKERVSQAGFVYLIKNTETL